MTDWPKKLLIFLMLANATLGYTQYSPAEDPFAIEDDDLSTGGGDIFNDFNEDVEEASVVEDERFYKYGRFFTFQLALGLTTFQGNRGLVTQDDHPTYGFGVGYFSDFQTYYGLGFEFSKHHMFFDYPTNGCSNCDPGFGFIDVSQLRFYFSYRYYVETANLGTAITYSNPYFIGRMEYWYTSNKYLDQTSKGSDSGGGLGLGLGFGLEFPIKIRESYLGVEFLWHRINFFDKFTQEYRPCDKVTDSNPRCGAGVDDLTGDPYTVMVSYVMNW